MFKFKNLKEKIKYNSINKLLLLAPSTLFVYTIFNLENLKRNLNQLKPNKTKILYAKGNSEEDEEKNTSVKSINSRLLRIEKKMDYLLEKDLNALIQENDFPKYHFSHVNQNDPKESLLRRILNQNIWNKFYMLTSQEGYTINDIIQPGIDNPENSLGLVSYSKDCYYTFDEILISAAQIYHKKNIFLNKYEMENMKMLISILNSMDNLLEKIVYDIKITTNRNLDMFPFSGKINRNQRRDITNMFYEKIKNFENEINNNEEKGIFSFFEGNGHNIKNILKNTDKFLKSCGFYKDFPDGRMLYTSNNSNIRIVSNVEDHLKMTLECKTDKIEGFPTKNLFDYFELVSKFNNEFEFSFDDNLGYVNTLINNLGSGTNFSVTLKIPQVNSEKFIENTKNIKDLKIVESGEKLDNFVLYEVSNSSSFYNFSSFLLELINNNDLFEK